MLFTSIILKFVVLFTSIVLKYVVYLENVSTICYLLPSLRKGEKVMDGLMDGLQVAIGKLSCLDVGSVCQH